MRCEGKWIIGAITGAITGALGCGGASDGPLTSNGQGRHHAGPPAAPGSGGGVSKPGGAGGKGGAGGTGGATCACSGTINGRWCVEHRFEGTTTELDGVWSDGPDEAWVVGWQGDGEDVATRRPVIARFSGCAWTTLSVPAPAQMARALGVWGSAADDVWIVGEADHVLHFDGKRLEAVPLPGGTVQLGAVSGTGRNDVWAVGQRAFHWDGAAWTEVSIPGPDFQQIFRDVWAVAPNDVFVVNGLDVSHFDGTAWTTTRAVTESVAFLLAVWSSGADAWAAGEASHLLRLAGGSWTRVHTPGEDPNHALFDLGANDGDLHLVGVNELRIFDGASFVQEPDAPVPPLVGELAFYQSVWVSTSQVWVTGFELGALGLGDRGLILRRQREPTATPPAGK
jgi:hypothetical protein